MARGFHAGPVFGIFGAAVAAAKIMRFTEDQVNAAIGLCVNLAGGNLESGGLREGAAVRNAMLAVALAQAGKPGPRDRPGRARRLLPRVRRQQPGPAHLQLRRRHANQPGQDHRRPRPGVAVPGNALSHLLVPRLQHRPHRRHGEAVRRAQHQVRERRSCRGGGELARDAVSQPGLSDAARRHGRRSEARQHPLLHRVRRRQARDSPCSAARTIRPRCWS